VTRTPNPKLRVLWLAAILVAWCFLIAGRLTQLQIVDYGDFTQRAARQQRRTIDVSPRRGVIYDRNGHELAMTISVDSVFAVPSDMPDPAMAAGLLGRVLGVPSKEMRAKLDTSKNFVWVARKLDAPQAERIRSLNLKGVYFQKETKRFYPKRELAAQVLGYVGLDDEGLGGIEKKFDEQLRGKAGKMFVSVDARQKSLGRVERTPEPGDNLVLTIDEKLQYIAERELDRAIAETRAAAGTVVIQNPKTGEILALASRPTFNPNAFHETSPQALKNRAVSDIYEPGSTFKIVTMAAALEEKLTTPDEVVDCQNGAINVFGRTVHDHKPFGLLTVSEVMQKSSDVGAIKLGLRLGDDRFDKYIRSFGFGAQTGIELPGETRGIAKPASRWTKSSIGSIAMGQEIGVNALQVASMTSAIANDGIYTPSRIVAGVLPAKTSTTQTVTFKPATQRRVVSTMTAAQMKRILEDTVLFGTGKKAILDGYSSAGKTGTAQKIDPATGRYSPWAHVASFAGFAPVQDPVITVVAILDSPVGSHHGGDVGAPLFNRVAQAALTYLNVPHDADFKNQQRLMIRASAKASDFSEGSPDRLTDASWAAGSANSEPTPLPMTTPAKIDDAARIRMIEASFKPAAKGQMPQIVPAAKLVTKVPPKNPPPTRGTVIMDAESATLAPSFLGKSVRAVIETAQQSGLEIEIVGSGVARRQVPAAGEPIPPGTRVTIEFSR
jgi:cell division protein FtsI (penicillin-binding protein 3)